MADDHATDSPALTSSRSVAEIMDEFLRKGESEKDGNALLPGDGAVTEKEEYTFSASTRAIMERLKMGPNVGAENDSYRLKKSHEEGDLDPPSTRQYVDGDLVKPLDNESSEVSAEPVQLVPTQVLPADDSKSISKAQLELVNSEFSRLMSDKTKVTIPDSYVSSGAFNDVDKIQPENMKMRSVQEILDDYKSDSSSAVGRTRSPIALRGTYHSSSGKGGRMNTSQNNETLDSPSGQFEQLRRVGSSVDADKGDFRRALQTKTSYSNSIMSRSRTSLGSFSGIPLSNEEKKQLPPDREKSDSDVDTRSGSYGYSRSENNPSRETSIDIPGIGFSFQRERERLRNIESIIKKTPSTSFNHGSFGMWMPKRYYQSKFMHEMNPDLQNRRAFSATDYNFPSDMKPQSLDRRDDILNRTSSSPTHFGQRSGMYTQSYSSRTEPTLEAHSPGIEPQSSEVDSPREYYGRSSMNYGMQGAPLSSSNWSPRGMVHNVRKPLPMHSKNRSLDVKKNRNMSKALTYTNQPTQAKSKTSVTKTQKKLEVRPTEKRKQQKETVDFNSSRSVSSRKGPNKLKSSKSSCHVEHSGKNVSKEYAPNPHHRPAKYMPYQPQEAPSKTSTGDPTRSCLVRCLQSTIESRLPEVWAEGGVQDGYDYSSNHRRMKYNRWHTASEMALSSGRGADIPAMPECDELWEEAHRQEIKKGGEEWDKVVRSKSESYAFNAPKYAWENDELEGKKIDEESVSSACDKSSVSAADEVKQSQPQVAKTKKKIKTGTRLKKKVIKRS